MTSSSPASFGKRCNKICLQTRKIRQSERTMLLLNLLAFLAEVAQSEIDVFETEGGIEWLLLFFFKSGNYGAYRVAKSDKRSR